MAAGPTYEPIATTTTTSSVSDITFSSITSSYTDLFIIGTGTSSADVSYNIEFNSDTASNYSTTYLLGSGTAASSGRLTNGTKIEANGRTNTNGGTVRININGYSSTSIQKTVLSGGGTADGYVAYCVGLWRSTSAINTIKIMPESGTISSGSTWTIYGIKVA